MLKDTGFNFLFTHKGYSKVTKGEYIMPRGDGTGPTGQGSFTGKGFGNCIQFGIPLLAGAVAGIGRGRRGGRGFCFWGSVIAGAATTAYYLAGKGRRKSSANMNFKKTVMTPEEELSSLKNQAEVLENNLNEVKQHILELEQK